LGGGNTLSSASDVATDSSGNVFVVGGLSENAFKINTPGTCSTSGTPCTITEIIDSTGDGSGNVLDGAADVATDSSGNVFVTGSNSDNAFKIDTPGTCSTGETACIITEIIDAMCFICDGSEGLFVPADVATDSLGNVFVSGFLTDNAFKITPGGTITEIIDSTGDGVGNILNNPIGVATDSSGNVFVVGVAFDKVFKIDIPGTCSTDGLECIITLIIDSTGDGSGNTLNTPEFIATDSLGNVFCYRAFF